MQYFQFTFTYGNGDYYDGYGHADDATYVYNQTWQVTDENGKLGNYKITYVGPSSNAVTDKGKIFVYNYYDSETGQSVTPDYPQYTGGASGLTGLGSEHGTIAGDSVNGAFGRDPTSGNQLEADVDLGTVLQAYYFTFTYGNGDYYKGRGYATPGTYTSNQTWTVTDENNQNGTYRIDSVPLSSTPATDKGKVYVFSYYDSETGLTVIPSGYLNGGKYDGVAGTAGLGSEHDILVEGAPGKFGYDAGIGKQLEADVDPGTLAQYYRFTFTYGNGDYYSGFGYAAVGTYTNNQSWSVTDENSQAGNYHVDYVDVQAHPAADKGKVYVYSYYDSETKRSITPDTWNQGGANTAAGTANLGSERDTIIGNATIGAFGRDATTGKQLEADIDLGNSVQYYQFTFTYGNGDYYKGFGFAPAETYTNGKTWQVVDENGQTGNYRIDNVSLTSDPKYVAFKNLLAVTLYYDAETSQTFTPDRHGNGGANNGVSGTAGLGSEHDTILGNKTAGAFGYGASRHKQLEADIDPKKGDQKYTFTFTYGNGDYYQGYGYAKPGAYTNNQQWTVIDENGQTGTYTINSAVTNSFDTTHVADKGKVYVEHYHDAETSQTVTPDNSNKPLGKKGLGSERGTILGNPTLGAFGHNARGKPLEADINNSPTGSVTIDGTATQGQTLNVSDTLADTDGIPDGGIVYHWLRNGVDTGRIGATYLLAQADVGKVISVRAGYIDRQGTAENVTSAPTTAVANFNDSPAGTVRIKGTATQGKTLTASNTLADTDGLGTITYHWLRDGADTGSTGKTYRLTQADVGQAISVLASYIDGGGSAEAVTSAATAAVKNINDAPTGSVTIAGTAVQGQTLTATDSLADADGIPNDGIVYHWLRGGKDTGVTGNEYTLGQADVGKKIGVKAIYTDGGGTAESMTSKATAKVASGNGALSASGGVITTTDYIDWQTTTADQSTLNLQAIADSMSDFDAGKIDPSSNQDKTFDSAGRVGTSNQAGTADPGLSHWNLTNALLDFHLDNGSDSETLGGDLPYQQGKTLSLANTGANGVQTAGGDSQFANGAQVPHSPTVWQAEVVKLG